MDSRGHEEFSAFVESRSTALLRFAVLLTGGDRHAAEDLLQIALMKSYGRWRRIDEPEAYVKKVMYRQQISRWRLRMPRAETTVAAPPEAPGAADPADSMVPADERLVVRQALGRLTPRQRTVLVLRYFEDLSETEVADQLGCSVGTVRSTTHRALEKLRRTAPEFGGAEGDETAGAPRLKHSAKGVEA
ncbi:SigE family RNA polymerase sigma factor [Streptomyces sp. NPDC050704]|uniref:SigE family RNA polymerase sigma factor n=1 Tax=Streptomyces sp. NPDC050704 TaxID=3157219 RepID=UPI00342AF18C